MPADTNGSGEDRSRLDGKPDGDGDGDHDDDAPRHRRHPLRTSASRRVVGGVIELILHLKRPVGGLRRRAPRHISGKPPAPCPRAMRFADRHPASTAPVEPR